jgi:hypothetical protein
MGILYMDLETHPLDIGTKEILGNMRLDVLEGPLNKGIRLTLINLD